MAPTLFYSKTTTPNTRLDYAKTIWKTSKDYAGVRAALRSEATKIIQETPKFGPMFDTLLSRELEPEYEDNLLVQLGIGK